MNEEMAMELRMALASLSMALTHCKSDEDRSAAKAILFESNYGIIALDQLESVLGLVMGERADFVSSFEPGTLEIGQMIASVSSFG